jgi:translation initiation factor IF-3
MIIVNREIQAARVKVSFWPEGELGEMPIEEARAKARALDLDLELANNSDKNLIPRCYIRDISQHWKRRGTVCEKQQKTPRQPGSFLLFQED